MPRPTTLTPEARALGQRLAASKRRTDAILTRIEESPPLAQADLDRIIITAGEHPALDDTRPAS